MANCDPHTASVLCWLFESNLLEIRNAGAEFLGVVYLPKNPNTRQPQGVVNRIGGLSSYYEIMKCHAL